MMTLAEAILLGLFQGITEFLPISSSGHLVLLQAALDIGGSAAERLAFDLALHLGTVMSLIPVFWQDLAGMVRARDRQLIFLIVMACLPTAIIGLAFEDFFSSLFSQVTPVALALLVTGLLLFSTRFLRGTRAAVGMGPLRALLIGLIQGVAIIPGISRSGTTIWAGMVVGLKPDQAARFSFLVAIPVILGACLLKSATIIQGWRIAPLAFTAGVFVAFVSGYLAVRWLLGVIARGQLHWFAYYCWVLGLGVLFLTW